MTEPKFEFRWLQSCVNQLQLLSFKSNGNKFPNNVIGEKHEKALSQQLVFLVYDGPIISIASSLFFLSSTIFKRVCNLRSMDGFSRPIYAYSCLCLYFSGEIGCVVFHQIHKGIPDPKRAPFWRTNSSYHLLSSYICWALLLSASHALPCWVFAIILR